jgi:diguanylate cyclase (GGDEF)-like protein
VPAAVALLGICLAGAFADFQNAVLQDQRQRAEVASEVSLIRAKLEGNINGNIQLVRGLIATLATEPNMDQARFAALASNLFVTHTQLRNIAAAPDFVIRLMYPLAGNEAAVGLDYRSNADQRAAALRARETGQMILAGPIDLVQGGRGFIGRFPVYTDAEGGGKRFWGIVSAVFDVDQLYADSGLSDSKLGIDVALVGRDAEGVRGAQFYGDAAVLDQQPVTASVLLPAGGWQIAAVPKGGWGVKDGSDWLLRGIVIVAGMLVFVPVLVAGILTEERQRHIRELHKREQELDKLSQRLELALDASKIAVWEYNLSDGTVVWDRRMHELYGVPNDGRTLSHEDWYGRMHPEDAERAEHEFARAVASGRSYQSDYRLQLPDGSVRHVRSIGAVHNKADGIDKVIGVEWDVSADVMLHQALTRAHALTEARNLELEAAKASIEYNALHDPLTGLPNRRFLDDMLVRQEDGEAVAVLHIDLDRFKQINDTLGHAAGDAMLVHAAQVLRNNVDGDEFVARIGGDEFVVVTSNNAGSNGYLAALADRIIEEMRKPVSYEGHECRFGVSVGIASNAARDVDARKLLMDADIALYRAKSRGRNRYEFFTAALQAEIVTTKRVADDILSALERREFVPFYQPQFDAETLDITGVEALVRWRHPERGLLAPDSFLATAEELSVMATIDRMVLETALRDFARWRALKLGVPRLSVNVSSRRLHDEDLIAGLRDLAIEPGTVAFELVESIYLDESDDEIVGWNIDRIKELGIEIEIDDFGTGYASIVSLMRLKPARLKIDRQLVMPILHSPAQRQLLASIIDIGRSLGIETVAEGVETDGHVALLARLGVDALQGFALARPMDAAALEDFVAGAAWRVQKQTLPAGQRG